MKMTKKLKNNDTQHTFLKNLLFDVTSQKLGHKSFSLLYKKLKKIRFRTQLVVSIGLFCFYFMPFSYTGLIPGNVKKLNN